LPAPDIWAPGAFLKYDHAPVAGTIMPIVKNQDFAVSSKIQHTVSTETEHNSGLDHRADQSEPRLSESDSGRLRLRLGLEFWPKQ